ncbi:MAG: xanthine dehydrogenase family protein subunit M, partial [Hyphomicrobiales bacterium]|nr:xanthine dehydrogenase family protein subunit M [Hyphomicrobiales bacterium]
MSSRILPEFELFMPESIEEAVEHVGKFGNKAALMAGGTDLMVRMKSGLSPEYVVSLSKVPGLDHINYDENKGLTIGAMATLNQVIGSQDVETKYPALYQSACENGTQQTRSVATVIGNLLNASPAGDCSCAILALGGHVVFKGPNGDRQVDIDDFWIGYRETA